MPAATHPACARRSDARAAAARSLLPSHVVAVRYEHIGALRSEAQAEFVPKFGTESYATMRGTAPGGGASALGT